MTIKEKLYLIKEMEQRNKERFEAMKANNENNKERSEHNV